MKKNLCLTFLLVIALTASGQDFVPVPRIAVHVNPVGYFMYGPVASLEVGVTKHLVLNGHVRLSGLGKMTKSTTYEDPESVLDNVSGTAFGGGPLYFFGKRLSKPYVGLLFEYDKAVARYDKDQLWEWTQDDKTMLLMVNAGYRFRFKFGLFINAGVYGGYGSVKDHYEYIDSWVSSQDTDPRNDKYNVPYMLAEVSIGFGF
jgi:opacity protein-like surface antigen